MSGLPEAALRYAALGWLVFPCEPRGKRPATPRGLTDATVDAGQIEAWWQARPDANVAVRTGRESGIVVLDVDGDDGHESLRRLELEHGELPRTASVVTPRRGEHYYFLHPGEEVRNSAGVLGVGLDVRGDGGYVLAPPSEGSNGRRYEPDERAPLAEPPGWLLQRIRRPANSGAVPVSEWLNLVTGGLVAGGRNSGLTRLTGHLLSRDVDPRLVRELILLLARHRCKPPLSDGEATRIVESIAGRELARRTAA